MAWMDHLIGTSYCLVEVMVGDKKTGEKCRIQLIGDICVLTLSM